MTDQYLLADAWQRWWDTAERFLWVNKYNNHKPGISLTGDRTIPGAVLDLEPSKDNWLWSGWLHPF